MTPPTFPDPAFDATRVEDPAFDSFGAWRAPVAAWSRPEHALDSDRFVHTLDALLAALPPLQSRAFTLRELRALEPAAVCAELGIDEGRLEELLHHARAALCRGLHERLFGAA